MDAPLFLGIFVRWEVILASLLLMILLPLVSFLSTGMQPPLTSAAGPSRSSGSKPRRSGKR